MTLASTQPSVGYVFTGADDYTFSFRIFEDADLEIVHTSTAGVLTTLTLTTDYTVILVTDVDGGTVTITWAVASTGYITIRRVQDYKQLTNWINNDAFSTQQLEDDLDRIVMFIQQMNYDLENGTQYIIESKGDWVTATDYVVGDLVINTNLYVCTIAHTAGTFATDLAAGKWVLVFDASSIAGVPNGGTTGQVLGKQSGADQDIDWDDPIEEVLPQGHITGMIISNDTVDADHDIDVTAGVARDAADAYDIVLSAITKQINAVWAYGTNQGGLDTGVVGNDTLYSIWAILRDDTEATDVLFSESHTAPTMPTDYTHKRWIGWVLTDGSANIIAFEVTGEGRNLRYDYAARLSVATSLSQTSYTAQALEDVIPTESLMIDRVLFGVISAAANHIHLSDDGTNAKCIFAGTNVDNGVGGLAELYNKGFASPVFIPINGDDIYYKVDASNSDLYCRAVRFHR